MRSVMVGIAGGTGSGKTTVAVKIAAAFEGEVVVMDMDSYYRDLCHLTLSERRQMNFDHPEAFDLSLFTTQLGTLKLGEAIDKPVYSFAESLREERTTRIQPMPIIIVEGILVLSVFALRGLFDAAIFVDTADDIRLIRRMDRDVRERGRSLGSVVEQYMATVRPMHDTFVEPSKRYADVIIPRGGGNDVAINMVIADLRSRLVAGQDKVSQE
jgi:uridine kinase